MQVLFVEVFWSRNTSENAFKIRFCPANVDLRCSTYSALILSWILRTSWWLWSAQDATNGTVLFKAVSQLATVVWMQLSDPVAPSIKICVCSLSVTTVFKPENVRLLKLWLYNTGHCLDLQRFLLQLQRWIQPNNFAPSPECFRWCRKSGRKKKHSRDAAEACCQRIQCFELEPRSAVSLSVFHYFFPHQRKD